MSRRNPNGQSEACVFTRSSNVYTPIRGNMFALSLRFNAGRTAFQNFGFSRPDRSYWIYFTHVGYVDSTGGKRLFYNSGLFMNMNDPDVKIASKQNEFALASALFAITYPAVNEYVIARL